MTKRISILIFFLKLSFLIWAQYLGSEQQNVVRFGLRCAISLNQQARNAAAFTSINSKGFQFNTASPLRIPNIGAFGFSMHYSKQNAALYHECSSLLHPALFQLKTAHALGFSLSPNLKVGVGIQAEYHKQPSYYGNYFFATARLGCQYALTKHHYLAITLDNLGRASMQQIGIEHLQVLQPNLFFAQGLTWSPHFKPALYVCISQTIANTQLQLSCGLFPQYYTFSIQRESTKHRRWLLSQGWQRSLGLSLQIGLILEP